MVRNEMYKVITLIPAKMQKLFRAGREDRDPRKNAIASVIDVTVIEGPACLKPALKRSLGFKLVGV